LIGPHGDFFSRADDQVRLLIAQRQDLLDRSIEALQEVPSLVIRSKSIQDDDKEMVRIHALVSKDRPFLEIEANIRSAWKTWVARGRASLHMVRSTPSGFELSFTLLDRGTRLTGIFVVEAD